MENIKRKKKIGNMIVNYVCMYICCESEKFNKKKKNFNYEKGEYIIIFIGICIYVYNYL